MSVHDLSNWDWPTFDPYCFKMSGMTRAILGCWNMAVTVEMLKGLRTAGIVVEDLYAFLYYGLPHERREVEHAIDIAREYGGIKRVWLDCEAHFTEASGDLDTEAPGMTASRRIAITMSEARILRGEGVEPGIYTGRYWWEDKMGGTVLFRTFPLWLAAYGPNSLPTAPITDVDFGGWTKTAAHQYTSRYVICGRERDANYWFLEDNAMTDDELLAVFAGGEEKDADGILLPREERLAKARFRRDEAAAGRAPSVREMAAAVPAVTLAPGTTFEAVVR